MSIMSEEPQEAPHGIGVLVEAFANFGQETKKQLSNIGVNTEPRGLFKSIHRSVLNIGASGNAVTDFGAPAKGRMWMVREVLSIEANASAEFNSPTSSQATSTGAAGASVTATLGFFSPVMTGFDVEIQPAAVAGLATITVTGAGKPTLTYYLEESTTNTVSKNIRFNGIGLIGYTGVTVSAVASGGIATVNVFGVQTGSPATIGWYVGSLDTSIGTPSAKPSTASLRWLQGGGSEFSDDFMPFIDHFSNRVFPVNSPDHLIAYISGGIGGENFVLSAIIEEYRIRDIESMRI